MKYAILLCDGMADLPISELNGKTPMEAAHKPNMDYLATMGKMGMARTVYEGLKPGSDVANLCVMGVNPQEIYTGRSPLEAAGLGISLNEEDITYRANLVTLSGSENYEDKIMTDYSAGEISSTESKVLIEYLKEKLEDENYKLFPGVSYRHLLVRKNLKKAGELTPPHDISGKEIKNYLPKDPEITELMKKSHELLSDHFINKKRIEKGLNPANSLWMWGEGTKPVLKNFKDTYNMEGAVISAVDLIRGIGKLMGLEVINVPGTTGTVRTNFKGKADAAIDAFRRGKSFVYVHMEAPDESGHQGNLSDKMKSIELIDSLVVAPVYQYLKNSGEKFKILIMPDHPTPIATKTHSSDPVPFLLVTQEDEILYEGRKFCEKEAEKTGIFEAYTHLFTDRMLCEV